MRRIDEILISSPTEPNRSKYAAHIMSRAKLGKVSEGLARLRSVDASPSTTSAWRLSLEVDLLASAGQKSRAEETAVQAFELGDVSPTVFNMPCLSRWAVQTIRCSRRH